MKVSVIIVSFNSAQHLARCLESVRDADEVLVIDNASADRSVEVARATLPRANVRGLPENRGFAVAVNLAAADAQGDALFLLNPDASLPAGAMPALRTAFAQHPAAWAVGFRHVDATGRYQLSIGPPAWLSLDMLRGVVQRRLDAGSPWLAAALDRWLAKPRFVPWAAGSALLVRRDAFHQIGGFDDRFFLYFEDIDLCLRLTAAGGRTVYDPSLTVVHVRGASAASAPALAGRAYRDSQLYFWHKHRGTWAHFLVERYLRLRHKLPRGEASQL